MGEQPSTEAQTDRRSKSSGLLGFILNKLVPDWRPDDGLHGKWTQIHPKAGKTRVGVLPPASCLSGRSTAVTGLTQFTLVFYRLRTIKQLTG